MKLFILKIGAGKIGSRKRSIQEYLYSRFQYCDAQRSLVLTNITIKKGYVLILKDSLFFSSMFKLFTVTAYGALLNK